MWGIPAETVLGSEFVVGIENEFKACGKVLVHDKLCGLLVQMFGRAWVNHHNALAGKVGSLAYELFHLTVTKRALIAGEASQDDSESTEKFRQQFEVNIDSVLDLESEGYPASSHFGVHHVPTMFVLDENGKIAERIEGFDKDALERLGASFTESELVPEFRPG